jgi:universal stress protein E
MVPSPLSGLARPPIPHAIYGGSTRRDCAGGHPSRGPQRRGAIPGSALESVRHILVGLDLDASGTRLTAGSRRAADQALWLAPQLGARVTLLHSTAADERWEAREGAYVQVPHGLRAGGAAALEAVAGELRARGIEGELAPAEGTAWLEVVRRVVGQAVDLVITGKRGDAERVEPRLGTVARKLLRECPCPVWVVKPAAHGLPGRVLAATDLSPVGEEVVRTAAFVAHRCGAALHVAHALTLPFSVQFEGEAGEAGYERRAGREATDAIERLLREVAFPGASLHVALTAPTRLILESARRLHVDLAVLGTASRGGLAGFVLGNTAERLLERLDCSLLAVKPRDFVCRVEVA